MAALGPRGENVWRASKLLPVDIEVMTRQEFTEQVSRAKTEFLSVPEATVQIVETLVQNGVLSVEDLSLFAEDDLSEMTGVDQEMARRMIAWADRAIEQRLK